MLFSSCHFSHPRHFARARQTLNRLKKKKLAAQEVVSQPTGLRDLGRVPSLTSPDGDCQEARGTGGERGSLHGRQEPDRKSACSLPPGTGVTQLLSERALHSQCPRNRRCRIESVQHGSTVGYHFFSILSSLPQPSYPLSTAFLSVSRHVSLVISVRLLVFLHDTSDLRRRRVRLMTGTGVRRREVASIEEIPFSNSWSTIPHTYSRFKIHSERALDKFPHSAWSFSVFIARVDEIRISELSEGGSEWVTARKINSVDELSAKQELHARLSSSQVGQQGPPDTLVRYRSLVWESFPQASTESSRSSTAQNGKEQTRLTSTTWRLQAGSVRAGDEKKVRRRPGRTSQLWQRWVQRRQVEFRRRSRVVSREPCATHRRPGRRPKSPRDIAGFKHPSWNDSLHRWAISLRVSLLGAGRRAATLRNRVRLLRGYYSDARSFLPKLSEALRGLPESTWFGAVQKRSFKGM